MKRETKETNVEIKIGSTMGITTTIPIFDHLLTQMAKYSNYPINIKATGDNPHHIVEDVGICLGQAFRDVEITNRISHSFVPMDDALAMVCVDFSDRGYSVIQLPNLGSVDGLDFTLITHFLDSFSREGRFNLHVIVLYGNDNHHIAEAVFKALGKALGGR